MRRNVGRGLFPAYVPAIGLGTGRIAIDSFLHCKHTQAPSSVEEARERGAEQREVTHYS